MGEKSSGGGEQGPVMMLTLGQGLPAGAGSGSQHRELLGRRPREPWGLDCLCLSPGLGRWALGVGHPEGRKGDPSCQILSRHSLGRRA